MLHTHLVRHVRQASSLVVAFTRALKSHTASNEGHGGHTDGAHTNGAHTDGAQGAQDAQRGGTMLEDFAREQGLLNLFTQELSPRVDSDGENNAGDASSRPGEIAAAGLGSWLAGELRAESPLADKNQALMPRLLYQMVCELVTDAAKATPVKDQGSTFDISGIYGGDLFRVVRLERLDAAAATAEERSREAGISEPHQMQVASARPPPHVCVCMYQKEWEASRQKPSTEEVCEHVHDRANMCVRIYV